MPPSPDLRVKNTQERARLVARSALYRTIPACVRKNPQRHSLNHG